MTIWQEIRWWFRHLVVRRLNGERKAARHYQQILDLGHKKRGH